MTNLPIELDDIEPWGGPPEAASSRRPVTKSSEPGPEPPETPPVYRDTGSRLNIFQRLREVMKDVPGIKKGTRHQQGYDYTGHEALTHALRPAYIRHGIVRTVSVIGSEYTGEHKDVLELTAVVRWTNVDDPTDFHEVTSIGIAPPTVTKDWTDNKTGVVTPGKRMMVPTQSGVATSYAQKNAEFKALCITGDDTPDAEEWS